MSEPTKPGQHPIRKRLLLPGLLLLGGLVLAAGIVQIVNSRRAAHAPGQPTDLASVSAPTHASGQELYGNYCAACHGEKGGGDGPAARYLYPKPRNFRDARFRIVTTLNHMPTDEDLFQVITRGMPGSAMFSFAHLSEDDRRALVAQVRQLTRTGALEQVRARMGARAEGEDLEQEIDQMLQPGEPCVVPTDLPAYGAESVARGTQLYRSEGCISCHGETGRGDGGQDQRDDAGMPIRPRDLVRGYFKGGHEPAQLYARIVLGMSGTPMPEFPKLQPAQVGDLINFVLSLSDPKARARVEHRRAHLVGKRVEELPNAIPDTAWGQVEPVSITVSPLWWRDFIDPELRVAALHDGRTLALRLTWADATRDDHPVRPQDFEDMAAVQLFKGDREPFLGMGTADKAVDAWLWRASWQAGAPGYADVDTAYPNMAVDLYPFEQAGGGARPHATQRQRKEFLTAHAAGNLLSDPSRAFTGSSLQAKGFGSLTMRPALSQHVSATGHWKDGRWTVVLRRPLEVGPEAGTPLAAGDTLSIAFALWDGAARDRNGQKLVSIWHDLKLE
jgi:mono/diheme cytochrome c family protein